MSRLFIILILLFAPVLASAQDQPVQYDGVYIQQVEYNPTATPDRPGSSGETSDLLQSFLDRPNHGTLQSFLARNGGLDRQVAFIHQEGEANSASITQEGFSNLAVMAMVGSRNEVSLLQQGDRNIFASHLLGDDNRLDVQQLGNDNAYVLDFEGSNLNHSVLQEGNGHRAVQTGRGTTPFSIEQRGQGAQITIHHNPGS